MRRQGRRGGHGQGAAPVGAPATARGTVGGPRRSVTPCGSATSARTPWRNSTSWCAGCESRGHRPPPWPLRSSSSSRRSSSPRSPLSPWPHDRQGCRRAGARHLDRRRRHGARPRPACGRHRGYQRGVHPPTNTAAAVAGPGHRGSGRGANAAARLRTCRTSPAGAAAGGAYT